MIFGLKCEKLKAQPVLAVRTRTKMEDLPKTIGENYGKIMGYITELGEQVVDAPYTAYYNLDMQDMDVEMGFPVSKMFPEKGDIKPREIPAGKAVTCMYKGPYSQMEEPYNHIMKWIAEEGYEPTGVYYEYYYNSPGEVPESELLTRIVIPVK